MIIIIIVYNKNNNKYSNILKLIRTSVIVTWCPWLGRPKLGLPTAVQVNWSSRSGLTKWWCERIGGWDRMSLIRLIGMMWGYLLCLWLVQCIFEHPETTDQSPGELVHIARQFGHVFFKYLVYPLHLLKNFLFKFPFLGSNVRCRQSFS